MQDFVKIHERDNVAVALADLASGRELSVDGATVVLKEEILRGHKFALKNLTEGEPIIKYGFSIGVAK